MHELTYLDPHLLRMRKEDLESSIKDVNINQMKTKTSIQSIDDKLTLNVRSLQCEQFLWAVFAKIIIIKKRKILVVTNAPATVLPRQLNARMFWLIQLIINNKERRKCSPIRIYLINRHPYSILHVIFEKITANNDRMRDLELHKLLEGVLSRYSTSII